jgi:hypothetical protein
MLEAHCDQKNCRGLRPHANREGDGCGRGCTPQEILYTGNGGIGVTLLAEPIRNWTGAPCSHQRTWVENGGAQPLQRSLLSLLWIDHVRTILGLVYCIVHLASSPGAYSILSQDGVLGWHAPQH